MTDIPPSQRRRRLTTKNRTGCKTCKSRRIKCDESRPSCQRCLSSRRLCAGYETGHLAKTATPAGSFLTLGWRRPSPQMPFRSEEEQNAFQFFQSHVVEGIAGPFDPHVWYYHVLPLSATEPTVRHAIIALGSIRRPNSKAHKQELDYLALRHYTKAMRCLNEQIASQRQPDNILLLVACLLFIAFELQHDGWDQSFSHLHGGLKLIQELQQQEPFKRTLDPLVQAFERLDIQTSFFTSKRILLRRGIEDGIAPSLPAAVKFEDVAEAGRWLNIHLAVMRELVYMVESRRFSPEGLSMYDQNGIHIQLTRHLVSLSRWGQAIDNLLLSLSHSKDREAARILQAQHICCKIKSAGALGSGHEMLWDSYLTDFRSLLVAAEAAITMAGAHSHDEHRAASSFSLDMGIIAPLYFTALKCRDPGLRRHAIALLHHCKHREGLWNGPQIATLAERVLALEERGLVGVRHASDIPERNRLYQAWYDLRHSDCILYCKRRRFETDGAWIEFEEYVV